MKINVLSVVCVPQLVYNSSYIIGFNVPDLPLFPAKPFHCNRFVLPCVLCSLFMYLVNRSFFFYLFSSFFLSFLLLFFFFLFFVVLFLLLPFISYIDITVIMQLRMIKCTKNTRTHNKDGRRWSGISTKNYIILNTSSVLVCTTCITYFMCPAVLIRDISRSPIRE